MLCGSFDLSEFPVVSSGQRSLPVSPSLDVAMKLRHFKELVVEETQLSFFLTAYVDDSYMYIVCAPYLNFISFNNPSLVPISQVS